MEFLELIQNIQTYIPKDYANVSIFLGNIMPYLFIVFALLTCFAGYRLHKLWAKTLIAIFAFLVGCFVGFFFPTISIYVFICLGIFLAGLTIYFSKFLHKFQLFIINFLSSYIFLPTILNSFLPNEISVLLGLIFAIVVGILSMKYMYLITILSTAFTGSILFANQFFYVISITNWIAYAIVVIVFCSLGIFIQFKLHKAFEVQEKLEKTKANKKSKLRFSIT